MANPFLQLMFNAANSLAKPPQQPQFEMYQPTYQNQNRFASLIDNMPQPTNPSIWRKIGGTLSGLGQQDPYGTAVGITNAPYFNELANWRMKAPFMQQAADNERLTNTQGLTANNQFRTQQINQQRADTQERAATAKAETDRMNAESRRLRDEAYAFKQSNPNWVPMKSKGGTVVYVNPQDPSQMFDTGIDSGTLTERDAINMRIQGQLQVADANNIAALQRTNVQQAGANARDTNNWVTFQTPDGKTMRYNPSTNQVEEAPLPSGVSRIGVPGRTSTTGISPAAQATSRKNRAQDIVNANPTLQQYISPTGTVAATKAGGIFGGATPYDDAFREKMVAYIEGRTTEVPKLQSGTTTPIRNTPGMPGLPQGSTVTASTSGTGPAQSVTMITPDGREVQIPSDKVSEAIARGARRK